MCKKNWIKIGFPWSQTNTNLSLSITGADSFVEGANTQYTASLVLSWVIGSPNTVLTVTLPAWITYVSSSDSGSESSGVITWTLGDLMANKSVTFTITSATPAPEYTVTGQVISDFGNLWTATASKEIEVEEAPSSIEIRFIDTLGLLAEQITSVDVLKKWWISWTSLLWSFTFSVARFVVESQIQMRVWFLDSSALSNWEFLYISGTYSWAFQFVSQSTSGQEYTWASPFLLNVDFPE